MNELLHRLSPHGVFAFATRQHHALCIQTARVTQQFLRHCIAMSTIHVENSCSYVTQHGVGQYELYHNPNYTYKSDFLFFRYVIRSDRAKAFSVHVTRSVC